MPNSNSAKKLDGKERKTNVLNTSGCSELSTGSLSSNGRARKRKRAELRKLSESDLESEFEDCDLEDAVAIENKLRKVAEENSLSDDEMRRLLQKFVKNEHVLALVTLKAEDEVAREKLEEEQRAIIITDTPSVAKLTRSRARAMNRTPGITLPPRTDSSPQADIEALIREELHSDEDDEEYTFKEDDFVSDDDPNTTASDFDSNPCTPQTVLTATEAEDSPVKLTDDGCFKIPLDKLNKTQEDLRIAARTRSKLCLQQTTIEDIESEFVPPDLEHSEVQDDNLTGVYDEDWMQFLTDFSKPLNNTLVGDDDDPINDPEYVAAEKVPLDAEELRDANISKKELTDLVSELFEGLLKEGVSLESVELDTPQKLMHNNSNYQEHSTPPANTDNILIAGVDGVTRQLNFDVQLQDETLPEMPTTATTTALSTIGHCIANATLVTQNDYSFQSDIMSTQTVGVPIPIANTATQYLPDGASSPCKMVVLPSTAINTEPELIAVPVPGQPNCFQLARVVGSDEAITLTNLPHSESDQKPAENLKDTSKNDTRYTKPYDSNFTWEYISLRKHIYSEYIDKFENLRNVKPPPPPSPKQIEQNGFTKEQHDLLQQQLRIHVQMLTQTFLQTYSHPKFFSMATKPKEMLLELQNKANTDASFNAWNLNGAVELITKWESDLSDDAYQKENSDMMKFINRESDLTNYNNRQVVRLPPRIMNLILDSNVFMYPEYLPRVAFSPKQSKTFWFCPGEYQLIAMGLEKHLNRILEKKQKIHANACPIRAACKRIAKDIIRGKQERRLNDKVRELRDDAQYNPVKYYFDHRCAPPIEHKLIPFENNTVLTPRERYNELSSGWKLFVEKKSWHLRGKSHTAEPTQKVSEKARASFLEFVKEAVGEDISLPESFTEAAAPHGSLTESSQYNELEDDNNNDKENIEKFVNSTSKDNAKTRKQPKRCNQTSNSLTINVNYVFGGGITANSSGFGVSVPLPADTAAKVYKASVDSINLKLKPSNNCSILALPPPLPPVESDVPALNLSYDYATQTFQPEVLQITDITEQENAKAINPDKNLHTSKSKLDEKSFKRHTKTTPKCAIYSFKQRYTPKNSYIRWLLKHKNRQRHLQKHCAKLYSLYNINLKHDTVKYAHAKPVQCVYERFRALQLYSQLLKQLKMFCRVKIVNSTSNTMTTTASVSSPTAQLKRQRITMGAEEVADGISGPMRTRKSNRQEENLRHMLQSDTPEEADRKDATFAFNFYEKVEEALMNANRAEDCNKFNKILQKFDPKKHKVADLYTQIEQLLLPDFPELVEVFLSFLLPAEAAQIGKFFEHFMITNATTFVNKLNIYFNKQPAQLRKIYACLSELAEQPGVNMKQVEARILPLLKGNQFLIDWFTQQFPPAKPPERLLPTPETISLHEVQNNQTGEFYENVTHLLDSPTQETQQPQGCQLKYINGRVFYGSKILLPAKLYFMANTLSDQQETPTQNDHSSSAGACVHGIRAHGENLLNAATAAENAAAAAAAAEGNSDDNERSEDDEISRALIIDTTCDEDNSCSSLELCDDVTLRAHAVRLNSSYYGNFNTLLTSTPTIVGTQQQGHHPNAKKTSINFGDNEQMRISPRKNSLTNSPTASITTLASATPNTMPSTSANAATVAAAATAASSNGNVAQTLRDKRKSPTKKIRSPLCVGINNRQPRASNQPMVVIHEHETTPSASTSNAIACAKRLRTLIEDESAQEPVDDKSCLNIIARTKSSLPSNDDLEFLPVGEGIPSPTSLSQSSFPAIKMDMDTSEEEEFVMQKPIVPNDTITSLPQPQHIITTQFESDEDSKLDVVATLSSFPASNETTNTSTATATDTTNDANENNQTIVPQSNASSSNKNHISLPSAWTRDEDKIILIEMKLGASDRERLLQRIRTKLPLRSLPEITTRHQFLMEFLSKLQGKM